MSYLNETGTAYLLSKLKTSDSNITTLQNNIAFLNQALGRLLSAIVEFSNSSTKDGATLADLKEAIDTLGSVTQLIIDDSK